MWRWSAADCIFMLDILFQFFTARWVLVVEDVQMWVLLDNLSDIAYHYVSNGLLLDVVGQLPWQYIDCVFPEAPDYIKTLRLLRLMKLFHLKRELQPPPPASLAHWLCERSNADDGRATTTQCLDVMCLLPGIKRVFNKMEAMYPQLRFLVMAVNMLVALGLFAHWSACGW